MCLDARMSKTRGCRGSSGTNREGKLSWIFTEAKRQILNLATQAKFGHAPVLDSATLKYECQHRSVITFPLTTSAKNKSEPISASTFVKQPLFCFLIDEGTVTTGDRRSRRRIRNVTHVPLGILASEKTNRSLSHPVTTIHTIYHVLRAL